MPPTGTRIVDHWENGFGHGAFAGRAIALGVRLTREGNVLGGGAPLSGEATVNQWKLISAAVVGGALGSLAFFLPGFALGAASVTRHLTYAHSHLIHQSTGVGTVLGAIFCGWMADRVGRRDQGGWNSATVDMQHDVQDYQKMVHCF